MPLLSVLNPFSKIKASEHTKIGVHIQEVIYYAESRFWVILNEISRAESDRKVWIQRLLHRELVWVSAISKCNLSLL